MKIYVLETTFESDENYETPDLDALFDHLAKYPDPKAFSSLAEAKTFAEKHHALLRDPNPELFTTSRPVAWAEKSGHWLLTSGADDPDQAILLSSITEQEV